MNGENKLERGADDFWGERFNCSFGQGESTTSEPVPLGHLVSAARVHTPTCAESRHTALLLQGLKSTIVIACVIPEAHRTRLREGGSIKLTLLPPAVMVRRVGRTSGQVAELYVCAGDAAVTFIWLELAALCSAVHLHLCRSLASVLRARRGSFSQHA